MDTGIRMGLVTISQQWIEDARLNHTVTSISLIPHWKKPVNLCAWTITKKTECLYHGSLQLFLIFRNFFEKSQELQKSQFLLGTLLPPVLFDLINFSKNCDFSNFLQFLEKLQKLQKSQFLLGTLVSPLTCSAGARESSAIIKLIIWSTASNENRLT